jgi:hypothetical protein
MSKFKEWMEEVKKRAENPEVRKQIEPDRKEIDKETRKQLEPDRAMHEETSKPYVINKYRREY